MTEARRLVIKGSTVEKAISKAMAQQVATLDSGSTASQEKIPVELTPKAKNTNRPVEPPMKEMPPQPVPQR
eukprot:5937305-Amphidinium_carterae.1